MPLSHLKINHFRNLDSVDMNPSPTLNFLYGANGSGKTSVLEAISVLAHGRSFRTRKYRNLIQQSADEFIVHGKASGEGRAPASVGVSRTRKGASQFRLNGAAANSSAELAAQLPLLVVNGDSFGLLTGPPKQRRMFFDWLVFHVKHEFRFQWRDYARCVKQRNSLLRRDKISYSDVKPWDLEIARLSRAIEHERLACIDPLLAHFAQLAPDLDLGTNPAVAIEYVSGWKIGDDPYEDQLRDSFGRDRKLGYTTLGPHKSDLKISLQGLPAAEILSRGQQKATIAALYVAEARAYSDGLTRDCVFLIDDMPAELDNANMRRVANWINGTKAQVFVTSVAYEPLGESWPDLATRSPKLFHVKHGAVTERGGDTHGDT